jgi:very-short-patch-repair endonuclease
VTGWPERAAGAIGVRQHAVITYHQLVDLGAGRGAIGHARRIGRIHGIHRGVYALVPPEALPPLGLEHAAVLACGPQALLSHHSAAAAWGIRPARLGDVEVAVVGRDAGRHRDGIRVHRFAKLHDRDIRVCAGMPIVSPARTLMDIAGGLSEREFERAFDEALIRELMTVGDVRATIAHYPRRPGASRLANLADPDRNTTATRSAAEELVLELVRRARLPAPEVDVQVGRFRADFLWRSERVIVEVDGYKYHRGRFPFERDHERDAEHTHVGFLVLRVTTRQLQREPEVFLTRLATALSRRARN